MNLENLDFANDVCLLSHSGKQMQEKIEYLNTLSSWVGLNVNKKKTKMEYTSTEPEKKLWRMLE